MATRIPGPGPGPGPDPVSAPTAKQKPTAPETPPISPPTLPKVAREERRDQKKQENQDKLLGEGRIGDETVGAAELAAMGSLVAARHLMVLLAKGRGKKPRAEVLGHVGE